MMLEQIKAWERAGQWAEIRSNEHVILSTLTGSALARALLSLGKAYEVTAATAGEYRSALRHTEAILNLAPAGSLTHTWALHRIACLRSDLADFAGAEAAAVEFLKDQPNHPSAASVLPWVLFHLGRVRHYQGRYHQAARLFTQALDTGPDGAIRERTQLFKVWSLAAAGRITEAFASIPADVEHISRGHLFAAIARVCLAARDWQGAALNARLALQSYDYGEMAPFDTIQATELCLILKQANLAQGRPAAAAVWFYKSATILAPWCEGVLFAIATTLGERGGERYEAVSSHRGLSAGHKRCGLRGAVG